MHTFSLSLFLHRSAYLSPCPSCLSLFFERIVALGACQPRALLRWCTPSLALHLILPLLVLHPFRLPTFLRLPHSTPLPFSLALSLSLLFSLSPSPPVNQQPTPPHPPESWCILHALVASMHSRLLRHAAQAQLEFLDVVDTFFIGTKGTVVRVRCVSNAIGLLRETVSADQRERTSGYRK